MRGGGARPAAAAAVAAAAKGLFTRSYPAAAAAAGWCSRVSGQAAGLGPGQGGLEGRRRLTGSGTGAAR